MEQTPLNSVDQSLTVWILSFAGSCKKQKGADTTRAEAASVIVSSGTNTPPKTAHSPSPLQP